MDKRLFIAAGWLACLAGAGPVAAVELPAPVPAASAASDASSPSRSKGVKRPLSAQELRDSATFPGEMRPPDMPPPQVKVPLGRKPAPPAGATDQDAPAAGTIDDRVARCKALADSRQRTACTRALAASEPVMR